MEVMAKTIKDRAPAPASAEEPLEQRSYVPPSRTGRAQVVFFVDCRTKPQFDTMTFKREWTLQSSMQEALDLLFRPHKLARIAVEGAAEAMQGEL